MKRIALWPRSCLLLGALCTVVAGCGQTDGEKEGQDASGDTSGVASPSAQDLKRSIGDYMPPLEGGTLKIAAPRDWEWGPRPGGRYLVQFRKKGSKANDLPRILVAVEDSQFPGLTDVNEDNLDQLVKFVSETVDAAKLKEPVKPIVLGETACAVYVDMARLRNALVARQTLKTVAGGRLYTIQLEAFDSEFNRHRNMGYAVVASMKFGADGAPEAVPDLSEDSETPDPVDASPATDAEEPQEPPTTDSE